jgi:magnesium-transporting ATPase (P-type)
MQILALLNPGINFLLKGALRAPFNKKFILQISNAQIIAIDLCTDMIPALALGAERPEVGIMQQPPPQEIAAAAQSIADAGLQNRGSAIALLP